MAKKEKKEAVEEKSLEGLGHVAVCMPLYSPIPTETFVSVIQGLGALSQIARKTTFSTTRGTYVHIARRKIAADVLKINEKEPIDWLLWIDSDSVFKPEDIAMLLASARQSNADILSGIYVSKGAPNNPLFYRERDGEFFQAIDFPEQAIFDVDAVGFGFLAMRMQVLKGLAEKHGLEKLFNVVDLETKKDIGEDMLFCRLARREGFKVRVNSAIKVGHAGAVMTPDNFRAMKGWQKQ